MYSTHNIFNFSGKPGRPEPPVFRNASDTEIYITWAVPRDEGQCTTLGYTLEYKQAGNFLLYSTHISIVIEIL